MQFRRLQNSVTDEGSEESSDSQRKIGVVKVAARSDSLFWNYILTGLFDMTVTRIYPAMPNYYDITFKIPVRNVFDREEVQRRYELCQKGYPPFRSNTKSLSIYFKLIDDTYVLYSESSEGERAGIIACRDAAYAAVYPTIRAVFTYILSDFLDMDWTIQIGHTGKRAVWRYVVTLLGVSNKDFHKFTRLVRRSREYDWLRPNDRLYGPKLARIAARYIDDSDWTEGLKLLCSLDEETMEAACPRGLLLLPRFVDKRSAETLLDISLEYKSGEVELMLDFLNEIVFPFPIYCCLEDSDELMREVISIIAATKACHMGELVKYLWSPMKYVHWLEHLEL